VPPPKASEIVSAFHWRKVNEALASKPVPIFRTGKADCQTLMSSVFLANEIVTPSSLV
jgi:hypothetical protein